MPYKYETKNCRNCEYCVKTDKGLYCSHREGHPKVTSGGWCIDWEKKESKMNDDLRYYGNPMNWEGTKGDLISREALKNALNYIYDCAYIDSKSKEGIASDIIAEIDNAPTVEYTFEEAFQKTVCEQRLYCPERLKGEWIMDNEHTKNPLLWYKCSLCGVYHSPTNYCPNCGADMQKGGEE